MGLVDSPARKSSSIVQLLESMGAVLYVKTNVPQSLMVCFFLLSVVWDNADSCRHPTLSTMSLVNQSMHSTPISFPGVVREVKEHFLGSEGASWALARI